MPDAVAERVVQQAEQASPTAQQNGGNENAAKTTGEKSRWRIRHQQDTPPGTKSPPTKSRLWHFRNRGAAVDASAAAGLAAVAQGSSEPLQPTDTPPATPANEQATAPGTATETSPATSTATPAVEQTQVAGGANAATVNAEVSLGSEDMQQRLQEGFQIAKVQFQIRGNETPAQAFARGLREIASRRDNNGLNPDLDYARYAIATAELAGVSKDQLRIALDDLYPAPTIKGKDGKDIPNPKYADAKDIREVLHNLYISDMKPENAQGATPEDRNAAELARNDLLDSVVKAGGAAGLPEKDLVARVGNVLNEHMPLTRKKRKNKRIEELQAVVMHGTTDTLAKVIANPGALSDPRRRELADLIKSRIKYGKVTYNGETKRWNRWSARDREKILAQEQLRALTVADVELKKLEDEYKKRLPAILNLLLLVASLTIATSLDLVKDETFGVMEGR